MTAVVCWLWGDKYTPHDVHRLRAQVLEDSPGTRFVCITDRPHIVGVDTIRMPSFPSAMYRESIRLWTFSKQCRAAVGQPDLLLLDLDLSIVGSIVPFLSDPARVRCYKSDSVGVHGYAWNPSVCLVRGNALEPIWKRFTKDPRWTLRNARAAGWTGTEQAIMGWYFSEPDFAHVQAWNEGEQIRGWRWFRENGCPSERPAGLEIVSFHGRTHVDEGKERCAWIR